MLVETGVTPDTRNSPIIITSWMKQTPRFAIPFTAAGNRTPTLTPDNKWALVRSTKLKTREKRASASARKHFGGTTSYFATATDEVPSLSVLWPIRALPPATGSRYKQDYFRLQRRTQQNKQAHATRQHNLWPLIR